jgi:hypothetical protein
MKMANKAINILRIIGAISIFMGLIGIVYSIDSIITIPANLSSHSLSIDTTYYIIAFWIMISICIACYISLSVIGYMFIRLYTKMRRLFMVVLIIEISYFIIRIIVLSFLGFIGASKLVRSISAAGGVANGGMMVQFIILFPLWAPILANWAHKKIQK